MLHELTGGRSQTLCKSQHLLKRHNDVFHNAYMYMYVVNHYSSSRSVHSIQYWINEQFPTTIKSDHKTIQLYKICMWLSADLGGFDKREKSYRTLPSNTRRSKLVPFHGERFEPGFAKPDYQTDTQNDAALGPN